MYGITRWAPFFDMGAERGRNRDQVFDFIICPAELLYTDIHNDEDALFTMSLIILIIVTTYKDVEGSRPLF